MTEPKTLEEFRQAYSDLHNEHFNLKYRFYRTKEALDETRSKLRFLESQLESKNVVLEGETVTLTWKDLRNMQEEIQIFRKLVPAISQKLRDAERELASARKEFAELCGQFDSYMKMDAHFFA